MVLICAINVYFLGTFLQNIPHPAYLGLVAVLAVPYLGLTAYLVLGAWLGSGEEGNPSCTPATSIPTYGCPLPGLDLLHRPRNLEAGPQLPPTLPVRASGRVAGERETAG